MKETILGIDLGTTNSEVGIFQSGEIQIFGDKNGKKIIPSVICFDESGKLLVGHEARNLSTLFPERSVKSVKRLMGSTDPIVVNDQEYSPQEISAMILKELKNIAEKSLGKKINKAVITVPAYFNDNQRLATKEAGLIAGLDVIRIINEPTAAALSYQIDHSKSHTVLVYDLGGGTFDISIVEIKDTLIEVIASTGDNKLGGDDFDKKLENFVITKIEEKYNVNIKDKKALARIERAVELAKIALSNEPFATIKEEYLIKKNDLPVHVDLEISRFDYEELIKPLVEITIKSVHSALEEANKSIEEIDEVLLAGGSTQTPIIRERLRELFGKQPRVDIHPDLCVVIGASLQAGVIAGEEQTRTLIDITPHAFGTTVLNPLTYETEYNILIEKNSPLPISKSKVYYPLYSDQESIISPVYQGENKEYNKNHKLGEFELFFSKNTHKKEVVFNLNLDLNGILTVTATEKETGKSKRIVIDDSLSQIGTKLSDSKVKIQTISDDTDFSSYDSAITLKNEIKSKLHAFSDEDRLQVEKLIADLEEAIKSKRANEVESLTNELSDLNFYL